MISSKIARENQTIIENGWYSADGFRIEFKHVLQEHQAVRVVTPKKIQEIVSTESQWCHRVRRAKDHKIQVVNADSFEPDNELVMNFANAYHPGGGYLSGNSAQEECLCAQSTLYASISSDAASIMYQENNKTERRWLTDYMLISPCVEIFRDLDLRRLHDTRTKAVITIAAPNLSYDKRMRNTPQEQVDAFMRNRLRQFFDVAAYYGYRSLTLGAWGCGAFGHDAKRVARYFYETLVDENMIRLFDAIAFAVYSHSEHSYNLDAFRDVFRDQMMENRNYGGIDA